MGRAGAGKGIQIQDAERPGGSSQASRAARHKISRECGTQASAPSSRLDTPGRGDSASGFARGPGSREGWRGSPWCGHRLLGFTLLVPASHTGVLRGANTGCVWSISHLRMGTLFLLWNKHGYSMKQTANWMNFEDETQGFKEHFTHS